MSSQGSAATLIVKLFRRAQLLKALFMVLLPVDLLVSLVTPWYVFVIFLIVHAVVYSSYLSARCAVLRALLERSLAVETDGE